MAVANVTNLRMQLLSEVDERIRRGEETEAAIEAALAPFLKPGRAVELLRECGPRWLLEDWRVASNHARQGRSPALIVLADQEAAVAGARRVNPDLLKQRQSILQQLWPVGENQWMPLGALRRGDCERLKQMYRGHARGNLLKARAFGKIAGRIPNDKDTVDEYWTEEELTDLLGRAA